MPAFGPVSRDDFVRAFRALGFDGPFAGGRHEMMVRGTSKVPVPNPHRGNIGPNLLAKILREAGVARSEWERLP